MSGLFKRHGKKEEESSDIDLLSMKVKDQDGEEFGEVVSVDNESIVIKHAGKFYLFSSEEVENRFGDLMIVGEPNMEEALERGEKWKDTGKDIIAENKHYDFSEKRREEREKEEKIRREIEKLKELALQSQKEVDKQQKGDSKASDEIEDEILDDSEQDTSETKGSE